MTAKKFLNIDEAAAFLKVSVRSVRRAVHRGLLPAQRDLLARGAPLLFTIEDLRVFSERRFAKVVPNGNPTGLTTDADGNLYHEGKLLKGKS